MKIPVTNNTNMPIYVGAAMVPAGETRHFEEEEVPPHLRPAADEPKEPQKTDPLAELLQGNVQTVTAALNDMPTEELERLGDLEQQGQARKGVLSVIADILLKRAADADRESMLAKVEKFSDEELIAALEAAKTDINIDPDYLAALEAEAAKRNPGSTE